MGKSSTLIGMNKQGNVLGQGGKQFGGIAKAAAKRVVREPMEVLKTAVGAKTEDVEEGQEENQAMQAMEQAVAAQQPNPAGDGQQSGGNPPPAKPQGFRTEDDYHKYAERSENKDEIELRMMRRQMASEWGVEAGMEKAREEYKQKEEERGQVEEQEKEQAEAMKYEKEKQDNAQVAAAKDQSSAEKRGAMG